MQYFYKINPYPSMAGMLSAAGLIETDVTDDHGDGDGEGDDDDGIAMMT